MSTTQQTTAAGIVAGVAQAVTPAIPPHYQWLVQLIGALATAYLGYKAQGV